VLLLLLPWLSSPLCVQDKGAQVLVEISGERHVVDRAHTRRCLLFQGGQWEVLVAPASAAVEQAAPAEPAAAAEPVAAAEEPPARKRRRRAGGSKTVGSRVEPEPLPDNAQQQQQQEREQGVEQEEEELAAAGDEQQPKAKTKAKKAEKQGNLQQLAAAVAGGGSPAPAAQPGKKGGHGPRKGPPPSYDVPDGFDPSVLPPVDTSSIKAARVSLPLAFCRRFLLLRRLVPDEGEWVRRGQAGSVTLALELLPAAMSALHASSKRGVCQNPGLLLNPGAMSHCTLHLNLPPPYFSSCFSSRLPQTCPNTKPQAAT
jgi:hypothetical protein